MLLSIFRKFSRIISSALLFNFVTELCLPLTAYGITNSTSSQGAPVSSSLSSMVDGYTGDFNYSVPLINVPGPNGENVPVSASYHAGIGVNQGASWIGLGWDYNPGEISRQVVDAPDDYNGLNTVENGYYIAKYGSLYYNNLNNTSFNTSYVQYKSADIKTIFRTITDDERDKIINHDIEHTYDYHMSQAGDKWQRNNTLNYRFRRHMSPHKSLAYDNYSVNGALSGSLKLFTLGETKLKTGRYYKTVSNIDLSNNRKPNFYFEGSSGNNIGVTNYTNSSLVNQTTNQIHSGMFVKYFTNAEINNNSKLFNNASGVGFLEYKATTNSGTTTNRRTENPDLIGAFQITDKSGITYHYSLPVYSFKDLNYNWDVSSNVTNYSLKIDKYASSWKLTAITGQDYQDANNNFTVDEGDTGYWVSYNYSMWSSDYMWSALKYGNFLDNSITSKYNSFATSGYIGNRYYRSSSIANGHTEKYYLNFIQTSTHTAFFIKSVKLDEQSYNPDPLDNNFKPTPLLKLDKIVLLNNEDNFLLINYTSLSSADKDSRFSYSSCSNALNDVYFSNKSRYDVNETAIKSKALKIVDLESNYCLAKKYSGNINNNFNNLVVNKIGFVTGYATNSNQLNIYTKTFQSSSDINNSGKLTLKKILFYDLLGAKITPSIDFGYDENNILKNPDFNGDKTDLWGYYKNDYNGSHFVTESSKNDVDAWSLKQINTSLGGQINVSYESDRYHKEGFDNSPAFKPLPCLISNNYYRPISSSSSPPSPVSLNKPHLIYPMQNVNASSIGVDIYSYTLWDNDLPYNVDKTFMMYNFESVYYSTGTGYLYQLVRKGNENGSAQITGLSSNSDFQEFDNLEAMYTNGSVSGSNQHVHISNGYGINYKLNFCSFLYGGGLRVKQIDVVESFKNSVYTQKFSYGDGYCAVVPKTIELAGANGPSSYDLVMSTKSLINKSTNSNVGYDNITQTSVNQDGTFNGSVVQTYYNSLISPYGTVPNGSAEGNGTGGWQYWKYDYEGICSPNWTSGCNVNGFPSNKLYFYSFYLNLYTSDFTSKQLGMLLNSSVYNDNNQQISSTQYLYGANKITEKFKFNEISSDNFIYKRVWVLPDNLKSYNCTEKGYTVNSTDTYQYDFSLVHSNYIYLIGTVTTKDGITISENIIDRDPYTCAPTKVIVNDPTQGTFETRTTYAYNNSSLYSNMGLKTKNETNRNLLTLVDNSKTIKNSKYVINESYVTYSNVFPTRYFSVNNKYENVALTYPWYRLDATYNRLLDDDVLTTVIPTASNYRLASKGTLYDLEGNRIEESGLNQRKSASKWGYNNHYKLADITNANYNSFAFSGFEDQVALSNGAIHFGGEIKNGQLQVSSSIETINSAPLLIKPHSGYFFSKVPNGTDGPSFETENFEIDRTYVAKVWIHKSSPRNASISINLQGTTGTANTPVNITNTVLKSDANNVTVEDWTLMSVEITVPDNFNLSSTHKMKVSLTNNTNPSGNAYFDDLSFHPKDAIMSGNVYNAKNGLLIAQLDNENFATLYNYDNSGRVISVYKEYSGGIKRVTESQYHFAKP